MKLNLETLANKDLENMVAQANGILRARSVELATSVPVAIEMKTSVAGARIWAKIVNTIDPFQSGAYAIQGDFVPFKSRQRPGTHLAVGGTWQTGAGADQKTTRNFALIKVTADKKSELKGSDFSFSCSGGQLVASSLDAVDKTAILASHEDLKKRIDEQI